MAFLRMLLVSTLAVFAPIKAVLITTMVLTMLDMGTGLAVAIKKKKRINSSGLRRTIVKVALYEVAVMCAFLVEKYLIGESIPLVKILGGLIGLTELISILENVDIISGNKLFQVVIEKLQSQSKKLPDKIGD